MAQSEFNKLYAHIDGTPADHVCQFIGGSLIDRLERCGRPATTPLRGFWYCEEHHEWYAARPDLRQINFVIHEVLCFNPTGIKRLTVNGRK